MGFKRYGKKNAEKNKKGLTLYINGCKLYLIKTNETVMKRISFIDAAHKRIFVKNYKRIAIQIISETTCSIVIPENSIQNYNEFSKVVSGIYQISEA